MAMLNGVKCARCRIPVERSDDTFSCPRCGVRDSYSGIGREIAEQLHEKRRRSLQDKVRNVLDGMKANRVTCPYRKSNPDVLVMQSTYDRQSLNEPSRLDSSPTRRVLGERQVR